VRRTRRRGEAVARTLSSAGVLSKRGDGDPSAKDGRRPHNAVHPQRADLAGPDAGLAPPLRPLCWLRPGRAMWWSSPWRAPWPKTSGLFPGLLDTTRPGRLLTPSEPPWPPDAPGELLIYAPGFRGRRSPGGRGTRSWSAAPRCSLALQRPVGQPSGFAIAPGNSLWRWEPAWDRIRSATIGVPPHTPLTAAHGGIGHPRRLGPRRVRWCLPQTSSGAYGLGWTFRSYRSAEPPYGRQEGHGSDPRPRAGRRGRGGWRHFFYVANGAGSLPTPLCPSPSLAPALRPGRSRNALPLRT